MSQRELFDSFVEAELHRRLLDAGIPAPRMGRDNVLRAADGRGVLQMDLSWPDRHLLVLIDGREFHARNVLQVLADQDKRNSALAAGWRVLEFTARDVLDGAESAVDEIRSALHVGERYGRPAREPGQLMVAEAADEEGEPQLTAAAAPLPPALSTLATSGFNGASGVTLNGQTVPALAISADRRTVIVPVDAERWVRDAVAWRADLASLRRLTLAGVICFRMPAERLADPPAVQRTLELAGLA